MSTLNPEKLAMLESIELDHGSHNSFESGHCAMEVVAWLADQGHTDAPSCASPVLRRYTITLNDRWDDEKRQALKPFLPRMVGTGSDGKDGLREQIDARYVADLMVPWLRLAGLTAEADAVNAAGADVQAMRQALWAARDAAYRIRSARRAELRKVVESKVREKLAERPAVAVADAAAAAAAAAAAVAVAVADAVADADADADAVADAVADKDPWQTSYSAAYKAARDYYKANPLPIAQEIAELSASQQGVALDLLERMIDPAVQA